MIPTVRIATAAALLLVSTLSMPALGAKWSRGCPVAARRLYPAAIGATTAPFAHPGHEIGLVLSAPEIENTGGFSMEPDGNRITVTFASLFGAPVGLPEFTATAVSPSTLYFDFPDAQVLVGQALAGPVDLSVWRGEQLVAHIDPGSRFVALPPANDVDVIVRREAFGQRRAALGTLDRRGYIWVPIQFRGFGGSASTMPHCPADFIPLSAFAVGVNVRANGRDDDTSFPPLRDVRSANLYLGDFQADDGNAYGTRLSRPLNLLRVPGGFGVSLCAVNDAMNLVLRLRGHAGWAARSGGFDRWVSGSRPLPIAISDITAQVGVSPLLERVRFDTFGTQCRVR